MDHLEEYLILLKDLTKVINRSTKKNNKKIFVINYHRVKDNKYKIMFAKIDTDIMNVEMTEVLNDTNGAFIIYEGVSVYEKDWFVSEKCKTRLKEEKKRDLQEVVYLKAFLEIREKLRFNNNSNEINSVVETFKNHIFVFADYGDMIEFSFFNSDKPIRMIMKTSTNKNGRYVYSIMTKERIPEKNWFKLSES